MPEKPNGHDKTLPSRALGDPPQQTVEYTNRLMAARQTSRAQVCVIVDAVNNGARLAPEFVRAGLACVHVRTPIGRSLAEHVEAYGGTAFVAEIDLEGLDLTSVLPLLAPWDVRFVLAGNEEGVLVADGLAQLLGTPRSGSYGASAFRDKFEMNERARDAGLPTLPFFKARDLSSLREGWENHLESVPVVIKPLRGTGGQGVHFCEDWASLSSAFETLRRERDFLGNANDEVLVQRRGTGNVFCVCTVSLDGAHLVTMVTEDRKLGAAFDTCRFIDARVFPAYSTICDYAKRVLDSAGMRLGPGFVEVIYDAEQGPRLIECAARPVGLIEPVLSDAVLGFNQIQRVVDAYMRPEEFSRVLKAGDSVPRAFGMYALLASDSEGVLRRDLSELELFLGKLPSVHRHWIFRRAGQRLQKTIDSTTHPGTVAFLHEDEGQIRKDHQALREFEGGGVYTRALA